MLTEDRVFEPVRHGTSAELPERVALMAKSQDACKTVLIGNGSVGKTSICQRFLDDGFQRVYKQTVGVDFFEKKVDLRGDQSVTLQVWDIGGQSIGSRMIGQYIWGSHIIFLCFDLTDAASFDDLDDWMGTIKQTLKVEAPGPTVTKPAIFLLGNKVDLMQMRKITPEQILAFVEEHDLAGSFLVSAQSGESVVSAFFQAAAKSQGIVLTQTEIAKTERVLSVAVAADANEGRTAMADEIEREDRLAEERKRKKGPGGGCCIIS